MTDYGHRSITTRLPRIAGVIERGNIKRGQRKGDKFILTMPTDVRLNFTNGQMTHVTVLTPDGRAQARLTPGAFLS